MADVTEEMKDAGMRALLGDVSYEDDDPETRDQFRKSAMRTAEIVLEAALAAQPHTADVTDEMMNAFTKAAITPTADGMQAAALDLEAGYKAARSLEPEDPRIAELEAEVTRLSGALSSALIYDVKMAHEAVKQIERAAYEKAAQIADDISTEWWEEDNYSPVDVSYATKAAEQIRDAIRRLSEKGE